MTDAPPRVTLVMGTEDLLVDRAIDVIVASAKALDPDTDVQKLDPTTLEPGDLRTAASPSLFGERTVLVVRRVHELGEDLTGELVEVIGDQAPPEGPPGGATGGARN